MEDKDPPEFSPDSIMMLRMTQQHHVHLSAMADQKAGFLIGGSVVLLGLVIGALEDNPSAALVLVGLVSLACLVLAIIAVIPRYFDPPSPESDLNRLFFGVFSHMDEEEFIDYHIEVSRDTEEVHRAVLRDIHQMGTGLNATKFKYLRWAFRVALWGMVASFAVALIELLAT